MCATLPDPEVFGGGAEADADAPDGVKAECEKKLKELASLVMPFIIRRTNDLLSKYRTFTHPVRLY